jgi:hypothetical protein
MKADEAPTRPWVAPKPDGDIESGKGGTQEFPKVELTQPMGTGQPARPIIFSHCDMGGRFS